MSKSISKSGQGKGSIVRRTIMTGNNLCSCGSGEKLKNCCRGKIIPFPVPPMSDRKSSSLELIEEFLDEREHEHFSYRDAPKYTENRDTLKYTEKDVENDSDMLLPLAPENKPNPELLGLSPNQFKNLLSVEAIFNNPFLTFDNSNPSEDFLKIPMMKQIIYFLNTLKKEGSIKATAKGNLSKKFVQDFYREFADPTIVMFLPHTEDNYPEVTRLRTILCLQEIVEFRSNKFYLTDYGEELLDQKDYSTIYSESFHACVNHFYWSYMGRFTDFDIIQETAPFNFYLLDQKAQDWVSFERLGETYISIFPEVVKSSSHPLYETPKEEAITCFHHQFLIDACLFLGILLGDDREGYGTPTHFKVSPFFKKRFSFFS